MTKRGHLDRPRVTACSELAESPYPQAFPDKSQPAIPGRFRPEWPLRVVHTGHPFLGDHFYGGGF